MKKFFTLAAAVLASFSLWAATESHPTSVPASNSDIVGISYTIPGTHNAGAGSAKVGAMPDKGIKFRLNRAAASGNFSNAIEFTVNEGHVINAIQLVGITNSNGKAATVGSIYVDDVEWDGTFNGTLPAKDASEASDIQITDIAAVQSVVFVFSDLGGATQGNICYTVTYDEGPAKQVVSTVETLTNAKINGVALDPNFLSELIDTKSVEVLNAYTTAPTVTFTKHVVITYDDESTKESDVDVEVVAEALGSNQWTASITIGDDTYLIIMPRATAYTVTYKLADETVLGTEVVAAGGHPAEYAQYEVMPLSSFNGWYESDPLETVDLSQVVVNADMSFYAEFDKAYAQSIDFEGMVINNGKSYDVKSALTANFYDYKTIDALDSLNNDKGAARNEPYLGLKIKKQGGYLACNVQPGTTIRIKFGYVAADVLAIAGNDTITLSPTNNKIADLVFPIMVETLVKLQTTTDKTVVIKQIMIDEPIATWMYPITYAEAEHGTVSGWTIAFPGEEVKLSFTMDEGYTLVSCSANEQAVVSTPNVGEFFTMPAEAVTVNATFGDTATAIDNAEEEVKAVKVIRNGQLFIEKNGVLYDAQGAIVK
ncbi:MAG: hypothetical protein IKG86_00830 [Paludibacteraceae bacterium]|nr:hypothetical protein [Paludibacteraceae bacterium]